VAGFGALFWTIAVLVTAQKLHHEMNSVFESALEETAQRFLLLALLDISAARMANCDQAR